ncbi:regulator [Neisseria gonorrhoeae]
MACLSDKVKLGTNVPSQTLYPTSQRNINRNINRNIRNIFNMPSEAF